MADEKHVTNLDGEDTGILNKKGWYLVTYYKSSESSRAYNLAVEKAHSIERQVGLRTYNQDGDIYWEVWEKW
ncbi:MAG: hypothetical protein ACR2PU_05210 [Gammaproteobacteria bacterium]